MSQSVSELYESSWLHLGATCEMLHNRKDALLCYQKALNHNTKNPQTYFALGCIFRSFDLFPKACECFERTLALDTESEDAWRALAQCFLAMDKVHEANYVYEHAIKKFPKDPFLRYGMGVALDRLGQFTKAEETYARVLETHPNFRHATEVLFRLGITYKSLNKYDLAHQKFTQVLGDPRSPFSEADVWHQIGHVHQLRGENAEAQRVYETVLREYPDYIPVLQELAFLFFRLAEEVTGDESTEHTLQAIRLIKRAIDVNPTDGTTWHLLGRCHMRMQQYKLAHAAYQQAIYRDSANPILWCSIGVMYFSMSQFREALEAYKRAILLNPRLPEVWFNLGILYEASRQPGDSHEAYLMVVHIEPDNQVAAQRAKHLHACCKDPTSKPSTPPQPVEPTLTDFGSLGPGPPQQSSDSAQLRGRVADIAPIKTLDPKDHGGSSPPARTVGSGGMSAFSPVLPPVATTSPASSAPPSPSIPPADAPPASPHKLGTGPLLHPPGPLGRSLTLPSLAQGLPTLAGQGILPGMPRSVGPPATCAPGQSRPTQARPSPSVAPPAPQLAGPPAAPRSSIASAPLPLGAPGSAFARPSHALHTTQHPHVAATPNGAYALPPQPAPRLSAAPAQRLPPRTSLQPVMPLTSLPASSAPFPLSALPSLPSHLPAPSGILPQPGHNALPTTGAPLVPPARPSLASFPPTQRPQAPAPPAASAAFPSAQGVFSQPLQMALQASGALPPAATAAPSSGLALPLQAPPHARFPGAFQRLPAFPQKQPGLPNILPPSVFPSAPAHTHAAVPSPPALGTPLGTFPSLHTPGLPQTHFLPHPVGIPQFGAPVMPPAPLLQPRRTRAEAIPPPDGGAKRPRVDEATWPPKAPQS